jgi:hypothetical protein
VRGDRSGCAALRKLRQLGIVPDGAPAVRTPSSGIHLYFVGTGQRNGSLHAEHLDFRSSGGYVLVPPSTVTSDTYRGAYRWERSGDPTSQLDWQAATAALRPEPPPTSVPRQRRPRAGWDGHTLAAAVERTPVGNRNNMLFWAFCEAARCGYDLRPIADAGLSAGFDRPRGAGHLAASRQTRRRRQPGRPVTGPAVLCRTVTGSLSVVTVFGPAGYGQHEHVEMRDRAEVI